MAMTTFPVSLFIFTSDTQFQTKGSRNFCFTKSSKLTVDYYTIGSASPVHLPLPGAHRHQIPLHGSYSEYSHSVAPSTSLFLVLIAIRLLSMVRILILQPCPPTSSQSSSPSDSSPWFVYSYCSPLQGTAPRDYRPLAFISNHSFQTSCSALNRRKQTCRLSYTSPSPCK